MALIVIEETYKTKSPRVIIQEQIKVLQVQRANETISQNISLYDFAIRHLFSVLKTIESEMVA